MSIRVAAVLTLCVVVLAGCAGTASDTGRSSSTTVPEAPAAPSAESMIYSAVVRQLVITDNTFGQSPFQLVYIVDGVAPRSPELSLDTEGEPFSDGLKSEIVSQTVTLPPVVFVARPEEKMDPARQGVTGVDNDGVIIGLGPIEPQGEGTVHVGAGFFCGGLCGLGLTYVVQNIGDQWVIVGKTGAESIS